MTPAEWKRKAVHAGMGLFALSLRFLTWQQAALCALLALAFNVFVMPRMGRGIYRDASRKRDTGIVAYAAMVLALILLFRNSLEIAAMVWAMMAFGDPAATIAGRLIGGPALPWNRDKTWVGLLSNWAVAGGTAVGVLWFCAGQPPAPPVIPVLFIGAAVFAFLESVRSGLDDNIVAAVPTALVLVTLGGLFPPAWAVSRGHLSFMAIALAVAVNLIVAFLAWRLGLVSRSGAVSGAIVGFLTVAFGGWSRYGLLWVFFLLGTVATKLGYRRKAEAGLAEADRGRRGAANVVANCAVPTAFLVFGFLPVCFPAAFAAALADTLGTEVGTLHGKRAFSPTTFRVLPVGTPGAISWPGTVASLAGSVLMAAAAWLLHVTDPAILWLVILGGFVGSFAESVLKDLGRRLDVPIDHDFANAFNTFAGGLSALLIGAAGPIGR
ncbi:MAG TPA: DUF92 domain-containing protein [Thermoanaerobaculia bacterium]|nr:DUF92 domain-containing protein [Thermoanaerobaculia bacterium]